MSGDPDRLDDLNPDIFVRHCPELSEKRTAAGIPRNVAPLRNAVRNPGSDQREGGGVVKILREKSKGNECSILYFE